MSAFRKKPVVIEATQWHKNGDHPADYADDQQGLEGGELRTFTGAERKANGWEGSVVRYFRHPDIGGESLCKHCGVRMHDHGWIDTLEGGHIVCPGDFIITGVKGERYPCKPDIFAATYEAAIVPPAPASEAPQPVTEQELAAKAVAPRVTLDHLRSIIKGETYTVLPNGRTTICQLTLANGFTVEGQSAVVNAANFDPAIGQSYARENAVDKIWLLEGYLLAQRQHEQALAHEAHGLTAAAARLDRE